MQQGDPWAARRRFGNRTRHMEEVRRHTWLPLARRGAARLASYALRSMRRSPAVALLVTITLALGIGANAATFTLIDELYLRAPRGVRSPETLRRVWIRHFRTGGGVPVHHAVAALPALPVDCRRHGRLVECGPLRHRLGHAHGGRAGGTTRARRRTRRRTTSTCSACARPVADSSRHRRGDTGKGRRGRRGQRRLLARQAGGASGRRGADGADRAYPAQSSWGCWAPPFVASTCRAPTRGFRWRRIRNRSGCASRGGNRRTSMRCAPSLACPRPSTNRAFAVRATSAARTLNRSRGRPTGRHADDRGCGVDHGGTGSGSPSPELLISTQPGRAAPRCCCSSRAPTR
jgi:hypothetical protein